MKRDLDLIRDLLLAVEARPASEPFLTPEIFGSERDEHEVGEHAYLLWKAGLVEAQMKPNAGLTFNRWFIERLTHEGHDYIATIRDQTVFNQTKHRLKRVGGTATLETVKAVATRIVNELLFN